MELVMFAGFTREERSKTSRTKSLAMKLWKPISDNKTKSMNQMRGKADPRNNLLWWYGGGDMERRNAYYMTSDGLTTTEDATDLTDAQMKGACNGCLQGYPVYPTYRVSRTCRPSPYHYPVKKRSRRRCIPLPYSVPPGSANCHARTQPPMVLRERKPSRKSLVAAPRRRMGYTMTEPDPASIPHPGVSPNRQKMFVYSGAFPAHGEEEERRHARVIWRKLKKGRGNVVNWCSQAVDSSTSADVKSVHSTYSRLSVDVTNEMAAMNRDIETILSRYESAFDHSIINELEERGLGKKKKHKSEASKSSPPKLMPEQLRLLAMEKPPLERLAELPIEYLKPRPPPSTSTQKESAVKPGDTSNSRGDMIWKSMLQDLVNRGIMSKLDDASLAKMQSTLREANLERHLVEVGKDFEASSNDVVESAKERVTRGTCTLQPEEKLTLSDVDKRFPLNNPASLVAVHHVKTELNPVLEPGLPVLVERSEELISVNKVDANTNWRKKLEDQEREASKEHCEGCKSLEKQLNAFKTGGSGEKVCEDKSVNTESSQNSMGEVVPKNLPLGEQNSPVSNNKENGKSDNLKHLLHQVKGKVSDVTVDSVATDQSAKDSLLTSGSTSCHCDDLTTNPSGPVSLKTDGMTVDADEKELQLGRTPESTRLGDLISSRMEQRRRPFFSNHISMQNKNFPDRTTQRGFVQDGSRVIAKQGAGDSSIVDAQTSINQELVNLVDKTCVTKNTSPSELQENLVELERRITDKAELFNFKTCLSLIRKLATIMLRYNFADTSIYEDKMARFRDSHIRHIIKEIQHLEDIPLLGFTHPPSSIRD